MAKKHKSLSPERLEIIAQGLKAKDPLPKIAENLGLTVGTLRGLIRSIGIATDYLPRGDRGANTRRFSAPQRRSARRLAEDHPAVVEGRTLFLNGDTRDPAETDRPVLISGINNSKLGAKVTHGRWAGRAIYQLSLEERATCPRECEQWNSCYGNGMHRAARHKHGPALIAAISRDLKRLHKKHPQGIVVRLHTLGDFYSLEYIIQWEIWLDRYPSLAVFGYTRRQPGSPMGDYIKQMRDRYWKQFSMRFSGLTGEKNAFVLNGQTNSPSIGDAFVCKQEWAEQQGDLTSLYCGNCTACWESTRPVVFLEH